MRMRAGTAGQRGFSMIELLVAVLVMGIGVLGISGLQLVSMQNNRAALQRAEAVQLAYDVLDRIRANPIGAPVGMPYQIAVGAFPGGVIDCTANNCTQAQMAAFDLGVWKCTLGDHHDESDCDDLRNADVIASEDAQPGLPEGDGSVAIDGAGVITVTVQWSERGNQTRSVTVSSQG